MTTETAAQQAWEPRAWRRDYAPSLRAVVEWERDPDDPRSLCVWRWSVGSRTGAVIAHGREISPEAARAAVDAWIGDLVRVLEASRD